MARKTDEYIVEDKDSRDYGKRYLITEMPPWQGEMFALKAFDILLSSGIELPDGDKLRAGGLEGLLAFALRNFKGLPWDRLEPLLNEMFQYVQIYPEGLKPGGIPRAIVPAADDIEEIGTRLALRGRLIKINLGFLKAVGSFVSTTSAASTPTI